MDLRSLQLQGIDVTLEHFPENYVELFDAQCGEWIGYDAVRMYYYMGIFEDLSGRFQEAYDFFSVAMDGSRACKVGKYILSDLNSSMALSRYSALMEELAMLAESQSGALEEIDNLLEKSLALAQECGDHEKYLVDYINSAYIMAQRTHVIIALSDIVDETVDNALRLIIGMVEPVANMLRKDKSALQLRIVGSHAYKLYYICRAIRMSKDSDIQVYEKLFSEMVDTLVKTSDTERAMH